jgi:hypothetical protein
MMTDQQIAEIRERLNAATPGPWAWFLAGFPDSQLIAHAPTDIADLLAEVERLRGEVAERDRIITQTFPVLDLDDWGTASHP